MTVTDSMTRPRAFKYYHFFAKLAAADMDAVGETVLEIDVDPIYGDPDLYVGRDVEGDRLVNTTHFYRWKSRRFGRDVIAIPIANASDLGVYQIGVYSYSQTQYRLTAVLRTVIHNLSSSESVDGLQSMTLFEGQSRFDWR